MPGEVIISLHEPYLGSLMELLPDLDMAEIEDSNKTSYDSCKDNPNTKQTVKDWFKERIGTVFFVKLTQGIKESVLEAINALMENPLVEYAEPNYIYYLDDVIIGNLIK